MNSQTKSGQRIGSMVATALAIALATCVGIFAFSDLPTQWGLVATGPVSESAPDEDDHEGHDHSGHDHADHDETESIELSSQARANLGLRTQSIQPGIYTQYIEVPGVVTSWPGQTHVSITSPLTGVINAINVSRGELIGSGTPLFALRLTHQDLVNSQEAFLTQLGQLDVEEKEIQRLASITSSGAIARKTVIQREYERDRLMAGIRAARQAMLLHGLSEDEIMSIERTRELIREVTVYAPLVHEDRSLHHDALGHTSSKMANAPVARVAALQPLVLPELDTHVDIQFLVTQLDTRRGESVSAGQQLAQLSDYSRLLIEGHAYQRDSDTLRDAANLKAPVQAVLTKSNGQTEVIDHLNVVYIGNEIGRDSRSLPFYVGLENKVEHSEQRGDKTYVSWQYKPGQRLTVRVPVSRIEDAIVVPKDAVAEEGPERYVFVENGDHFDRVPVEVMARDSVSVAIRNDGQVWPGQSIAVSGAHQLQMAMKNQSGGAIDPHAGHNH